jgi:hypothetical protein
LHAAIEANRLAEEANRLAKERLNEEHTHRKAVESKAGRQKAIRTDMAAAERLLQSFERNLAAGLFNQSFSGVPLGAFLGLLVKKRLGSLAKLKADLDDLSDIRFMEGLQQRFSDLAAGNPSYLGSGSQYRIKPLNLLGLLAQWAGHGSSWRPTIYKARVSSLLEALRSGTEKRNSLDKIRTQLQEVADTRKEVTEFNETLERKWADVNGFRKTLSSAGMGAREMEYILGQESDPEFKTFESKLLSITRELDKCDEILKSAEAAWSTDKTLLERAVQEADVGQFIDADRTQNSMSSQDWRDFDATQVKRVLQNEIDRLLGEVDALLPSRKEDAAALADKHSRAYEGSPVISQALRSRHSVLLAELKWERFDRRRNRILLGIFVMTAILWLLIKNWGHRG